MLNVARRVVVSDERGTRSRSRRDRRHRRHLDRFGPRGRSDPRGIGRDLVPGLQLEEILGEMAREAREAQARLDERHAEWRRLKIDHIPITTGEPYVDRLTSFFRARKKARSR